MELQTFRPNNIQSASNKTSASSSRKTIIIPRDIKTTKHTSYDKGQTSDIEKQEEQKLFLKMEQKEEEENNKKLIESNSNQQLSNIIAIEVDDLFLNTYKIPSNYERDPIFFRKILIGSAGGNL